MTASGCSYLGGARGILVQRSFVDYVLGEPGELMPTAYESLVGTGFVGSVKRDVLLNASSDLEYLAAIRGQFLEAGDEARFAATSCAVQLVEELVAMKLCVLATWDSGYGGEHVPVQMTGTELVEGVEECAQRDSNPFKYFLVATEAGAAWVERYMELVDELSVLKRC